MQYMGMGFGAKKSRQCHEMRDIEKAEKSKSF
jgi:hypothetical protein